MTDKHLKIGLALGSDSARGWGHIGVIRKLERLGIKADMVCGCSIGALVGASLACERLHHLEAWLEQLSVREIVKLVDLGVSNGSLIQGSKLSQAFHQFMDDKNIEELPMQYGAVATNMDSGRETWLKEGSLMQAVRASIALPGLFPPIKLDQHWFIDGGLVNPVPVSMCRAMGADIVIAVNLNSELTGNKARLQERENRFSIKLPHSEMFQKVGEALRPLKDKIDLAFPLAKQTEQSPGIFTSMSSAIDIMQDRITKSRLAGDPPDILISPHLAHMGLLEFDCSQQAIEEGCAAVHRAEHNGALRSITRHK